VSNFAIARLRDLVWSLLIDARRSPAKAGRAQQRRRRSRPARSWSLQTHLIDILRRKHTIGSQETAVGFQKRPAATVCQAPLSQFWRLGSPKLTVDKIVHDSGEGDESMHAGNTPGASSAETRELPVNSTVAAQNVMQLSWKSRRPLMMTIVGLSAVALVGCAGKYTGGGYIDSVIVGANSKATFGFNIDGTDVDGDGNPDLAKGQFQYDDHAAGVSFHVVVDERPLGLICNPDCVTPGASIMVPYAGSYSSKDGSGNVTLAVTSINDGFGNQVDSLWIYGVSSGPYAGYSNYGVVQGGKIKFHPQK